MPTQHRSRTQDRSTASTGEALRSIFNRNFNVVACINLLVMTAYYLMFVTSTAYARATYGASLSSAGLTAGIMVIGCLIGRFLTGNLLSLCGCRAILFAGLLLYSASIAAFFWVPNLALLFVQRLSWAWAWASWARPPVPSWPMWCPTSITDWASACSA